MLHLWDFDYWGKPGSSINDVQGVDPHIIGPTLLESVQYKTTVEAIDLIKTMTLATWFCMG